MCELILHHPELQMPDFTFEEGELSLAFLENVNTSVLMLNLYLAMHRYSKRRAPNWLNLTWGNIQDWANRILDGSTGLKSEVEFKHGGNKDSQTVSYFKVMMICSM